MPTWKTGRLNAHYALLQAAYWAGYATVWGYLSVLLLSKGFSNAQTGLISAIALLSTVVVQPWLSGLADRHKAVTSRLLALGLTGLLLVFIVVVWVSPAQWLTAAALVGVGLTLTAIAPYFNAMAMELTHSGAELNYGLGRGVGSVCFAVATWLLGMVLEKSSPSILFPIGMAIFAVMLLAVFFFRYTHTEAQEASPQETGTALSTPQLLKKYPAFLLLMVGCALLMAGHSSTNTYMNHIVSKAGAGESAMGTVLAISAMVELPSMSLFPKLQRKLSLPVLFRICAVSYCVRNLLFLVGHSMPVFYIAAVLQCTEYAFFIPATVYYVSERIDLANQVKGQALIYTASSGIGSAVGAITCGMALDRGGPNAMLWLTQIFITLGMLVVFLATARRTKREERK